MRPLIALLGAIALAELYRTSVNPENKRQWESSVKMHHGEAGALMVAAGLLAKSPAWAAAGAGLMAHD